MGFFTKFGDGGAYVPPLSGLNKRRVRVLARSMGGSPRDESAGSRYRIAHADPDEDGYGVSYEEIDNLLDGKEVSEEKRLTIRRFNMAMRHKRCRSTCRAKTARHEACDRLASVVGAKAQLTRRSHGEGDALLRSTRIQARVRRP